MNKLINTMHSSIAFTLAVILLIAINSPNGFTQSKPLVVVQDENGIHNSLSFSPDGERLLTTGSKTAIVWDAKTGEKLLTFEGHIPYGGAVACGDFSPDGTKIATGGYSYTALIWDSKTGKIEFKAKFIEGMLPNHIDSVAFSPNGENIAIGGGPVGLSIWDILSNNMIIQFNMSYQANKMEYFPEGGKILTQYLGNIKVISVKGEILMQYSINGIAALSKDGKYIRNIVGDIDGILDKYELRIIDVETNERISSYTFNAKRGTPYLSTDGQFIVAASEKSPEGIGIRKVGALDSVMRSFSLEANVDYNYMKVAFSDDNKKFACMIDTKAYIYDISDITSVIKESTAQ
ncbi:MAG: hypothetical protein AB1656_25835 [Candidatus Omnitrophota bacterium]